MSRVRIYELAKEAGLKSKELADKLIALGYPIKGHSSTVDDDMAADIRRKVLGKATAEVTEKPIGVTKKTTVVRKKRTTVVRRRSKAQKEELARQAEEAEYAETAEAMEAEVAAQAEGVEPVPGDVEAAAELEEKTAEGVEPVETERESAEDAPAEAVAEHTIPDTADQDTGKTSKKPVKEEP